MKSVLSIYFSGKFEVLPAQAAWSPRFLAAAWLTAHAIIANLHFHGMPSARHGLYRRHTAPARAMSRLIKSPGRYAHTRLVATRAAITAYSSPALMLQ